MKTIIRKLTLCALLGAPMSAHAVDALFTNGDFETPDGASWAVDESTTAFTYPTSGGNPNGYGVMDANGGQWGIWINDNNSVAPLASLGLVAGETYVFKWDMKIEDTSANSNPGGIKVESWNAGAIDNSGEFRPATLIGSGATWETYELVYTVNAAATGIKIVPLWGPNSKVGYDNFRVDNTPVVPPLIVPIVPNGDFETPGGASWAFFQGGGQTVSYPASGGNPGGFGQINSFGLPEWAVLVWNNNAPITLAALGLTAGETYKFSMDMKILQGTNIGGIKVDFIPGSTGDIFPSQLIGNGSSWETYTFDITIPLGVTQINLVPVGGPGSDVGFDNIKILLPPPPPPLQATIAQGTALSWTPPSAINAYQPQESPDGSNWTNLGPQLVGNTVTSLFDGTTSAFYRVMESVPGVEEAVFNGSFEDVYFLDPPAVADGWSSPDGQLAQRITTDARTGSACMQIKAVNGTPFVAPPAESQTSQNTFNANFDGGGTGTITVGNTYTLSFWAKQISYGPSYVQEYRVSWLNGSGAEIEIGIWQPFSSTVGGTWEEKTLSGLVAPVGATTAFIQITGKLGGVDGAEGEVLIDDVTLMSNGFTSPTELAPAPTTAPAVEISWPSDTGQDYQVQSSTDLSGWSNFGGVISGDDTTKSVFEAISGPKKFYKVGELP